MSARKIKVKPQFSSRGLHFFFVFNFCIIRGITKDNNFYTLEKICFFFLFWIHRKYIVTCERSKGNNKEIILYLDKYRYILFKNYENLNLKKITERRFNGYWWGRLFGRNKSFHM